jgi:hypothetical protein
VRTYSLKSKRSRTGSQWSCASSGVTWSQRQAIRAKDGKLITDNGEMCNVFNDYLASAVTDEIDMKELPEVKKFDRAKLHAR